MQPSEEAQLLVNEGALFRRLGDPLKAIETYRQAQTRFARAQHPDGEISAWRNIGIVFALDLEDSGRALEAFSAALQLARRSSNRRGEVQALLYRGETLRRMGRLAEAHTDLRAALDGATSAGLSEEQWKALYSVGRALEADGHADEARHTFEQAIGIIETIRTDLRTFALRSEFLADRRDVYDALIALRLSEDSAAPDEVFPLLERTRARTWQDRMQSEPEPHSLREIQRTMAQGELLLEYWTSAAGSALVWAASTTAGIVQQARSGDESQAIQALSDRVSQPGDSWRPASITAGRTLLSGLPDLRAVTRLIVIPDGPLHFVPFEALTIPGTNDLVIEKFAVSYLPSSTFLVRHGLPQMRRWKWPWQRELVAFGDPPAERDRLADGPDLARLSYATEEIRAIAASLPGAAELHVGAAAQKRFLDHGLRGVPLLHFSTHAIADTRDPERSRVLLAPAAPGAPSDYLFLREIYELDLAGVQLATMSACDTERGTVIRGEGVEGFSRALLAAGAASSVTTMWDVVDRASAEFMKQFYFALAQGQSEAVALQWAKLQFLHSRLDWSHPRYWAGYVLNGNGRERLPRVVPWSVFLGALIVTTLVIATVTRRLMARRR
jgi:tetratricopeptide (TPR) repeat protein